MILTHKLLHSAGTSGCGFNATQLRLLGVPWPPKKGWLSALIGKDIPESTWRQVLKLKGVRSRKERHLAVQYEGYLPRLF